MRKSLLILLLLTACGNLDRVGRSPQFEAMPNSPAQNGVYSSLPPNADARGATEQSSLWTAQRSSLLGDHRASARGDILTVVVEINDQATINDSTGRSRTASEKMGMPSLWRFAHCRPAAGAGEHRTARSGRKGVRAAG